MRPRDREGASRGAEVRRVATAAVLMLLWLAMSGLFKPLIIGFGVASVLVVALVTWRMDRTDGDRLLMQLKPLAFAGYILWLLVEIARANWAVTKIVLSPRIRTRQHLFPVRTTQATDLGQVIFANSITLTPGTITVETEPGRFLVHALDYSADDNLALADMDARVSRTEAA